MSAATDKRKSPSHDFRERIRDWLDERVAINEGLDWEGPRLIQRLMKDHSLREIARLSELSPTYLSNVLNERISISPGAFVTLSYLES